jgi:5-deoxy-glucuronate isomerase
MSGLVRADGELTITPESAGWGFSGLRVLELGLGERRALDTGGDELIVLPLSGACTVQVEGEPFALAGRAGVFAGVTDFLYVPRDARVEIACERGGRFALPSARADRRLPVRYVPATDVPVELRGAGQASRQVNNFCAPEALEADRLIAVEVLTPAGNWSSYPPHKHDVHDMPREADLEEIYYYRIDPPDGFGLQRLYTADGQTDAAYVIHDGDLLLVPEGYHAFAVAQGYTGYYLNVLAGDEPVRTMQPSDDPAYAWVRGTWSDDLNAGLTSWRDIAEQVNGPAGRLPG